MDILDMLYRLKDQRVPWIFCLRADSSGGNACSNIILHHRSPASPAPLCCRRSKSMELPPRRPKGTSLVAKIESFTDVSSTPSISSQIVGTCWNKRSGCSQLNLCPLFSHMRRYTLCHCFLAFCSRACEVFLQLKGS